MAADATTVDAKSNPEHEADAPITIIAMVAELQRRVTKLSANPKTNHAKLTALTALFRIAYDVASTTHARLWNSGNEAEIQASMLAKCRDLCHEKGPVPPYPTTSSSAVTALESVNGEHTSRGLSYQCTELGARIASCVRDTEASDDCTELLLSVIGETRKTQRQLFDALMARAVDCGGIDDGRIYRYMAIRISELINGAMAKNFITAAGADSTVPQENAG